MKIELYEGERVDDLQRNGYRIIQNRDGFCFGMDAVLLSGFARVKERECAFNQGKNGMVFAHADILARMILGAALTDDDVARNNRTRTRSLERASWKAPTSAGTHRTRVAEQYRLPI